MNPSLYDLTSFRPCLLIAQADPGDAARTARSFRRLGWDVYTARTGPEVRRLARMLDPRLVVLDTLLPEESGWLTCEKLTHELADVRVLLVDDDACPERKSLADFVGAAALVARGAGPDALLDLAGYVFVPAAG
jgi:DNA-binding response OmpR family regulator